MKIEKVKPTMGYVDDVDDGAPTNFPRGYLRNKEMPLILSEISTLRKNPMVTNSEENIKIRLDKKHPQNDNDKISHPSDKSVSDSDRMSSGTTQATGKIVKPVEVVGITDSDTKYKYFNVTRGVPIPNSSLESIENGELLMKNNENESNTMINITISKDAMLSYSNKHTTNENSNDEKPLLLSESSKMSTIYNQTQSIMYNNNNTTLHCDTKLSQSLGEITPSICNTEHQEMDVRSEDKPLVPVLIENRIPTAALASLSGGGLG